VNARALIDEVVSEHLAAPRCDVSGPSDLILQTDEDLLRSILRNLLDNAAKYSPDGSRILVNLAGQALSGTDGVEFNVLSQAGDAGLPDVERLFSKYYRSKGAHRHPGSGLGLFLVAGWLKALGGTISYTPIEQADGTVLVKFSVWLPG
jgi:signal transduction histidine kinase